MDLAGVITTVESGVTAFHVGDEVYGLIGGVAGVQGSLAEHAAVDADLLAIKPSNYCNTSAGPCALRDRRNRQGPHEEYPI
jgi:NADPH:quinone reductase-like Zn-dependent oxidoreductase